ncbi:hypothetical protein KL921_004070 [Ogataea angusta]|nr:hypothetical protein KL921_004070 [Ogataea angusta]
MRGKLSAQNCTNVFSGVRCVQYSKARAREHRDPASAIAGQYMGFVYHSTPQDRPVGRLAGILAPSLGINLSSNTYPALLSEFKGNIGTSAGCKTLSSSIHRKKGDLVTSVSLKPLRGQQNGRHQLI